MKQTNLDHDVHYQYRDGEPMLDTAPLLWYLWNRYGRDYPDGCAHRKVTYRSANNSNHAPALYTVLGLSARQWYRVRKREYHRMKLSHVQAIYEHIGAIGEFHDHYPSAIEWTVERSPHRCVDCGDPIVNPAQPICGFCIEERDLAFARRLAGLH